MNFYNGFLLYRCIFLSENLENTISIIRLVTIHTEMNIAEVIAKEIRVDKALFMLRSMKFTWCQNPITILRSELQILGLDWTVFEKDPILFCNLKQKLYGMFCGKFRKYQPLLHLINQRQW